MSREDSVMLASRTLALLLTVWALAEVCNLPGHVQLFRYYSDHETVLGAGTGYWQFWRQHYFIDLCFTAVKTVGFGLAARWLFKGGADVQEFLLPSSTVESAPQE